MRNIYSLIKNYRLRKIEKKKGSFAIITNDGNEITADAVVLQQDLIFLKAQGKKNMAMAFMIM